MILPQCGIKGIGRRWRAPAAVSGVQPGWTANRRPEEWYAIERTAQPAAGSPRPQLYPVPAGAGRGPVPRRHGRGRDQDRSARRKALRAHLVGMRSFPQRDKRILPLRQPQPAQSHAGPEAARGASDRQAVGGGGRRPGAEFPAGRGGPPGPGLRRTRRAQSPADLRLRFRIRRDESVPGSARPGPVDPGDERSGQHFGTQRRAAHAHRIADRRPARSRPAGHGGRGGALRSHQDRTRAKDRSRHAARGARSATRGPDLLPQWGADAEERDQSGQHGAPRPVRGLPDERQLPGALLLSPAGPAGGAAIAGAGPHRQGAVQLPRIGNRLRRSSSRSSGRGPRPSGWNIWSRAASGPRPSSRTTSSLPIRWRRVRT